MLDLTVLRERFRKEYSRFKELGEYIEAELKVRLPTKGIRADVASRPKEESSFLRKALSKHAADPVKYADPFSSIHDRAGIRILAQHKEDARGACEVVHDLYVVDEFEDTRDRLAVDQLGYLGLHLLVQLKSASAFASDPHLLGAEAEIQVHTLAQHAWSAVSHPLLYKPAGGQVSSAIARRVNRSVALLDLFDDEIAHAREELLTEEGYKPAALLAALEKQFLLISPRDFSRELSLQVLQVVEPLYADLPPAAYDEYFQRFLTDRLHNFSSLYVQYADDPDVNPLLYQPECLALFDLVTHKPARLQTQWVTSGKFDLALLEDLRNVFGR